MFEESNLIDSFQGEYRFLSNFYPCKILYKGIEYPSVENAYQAQKVHKDFENVKKHFTTLTAGQAKRYGRGLPKIDPDWDTKKYFIMCDLLRIKFYRNEELKQKLIDTGHKFLIEGNTWGDTYWGMCDGKGENRLGEILMLIRKDLTD